jgi:pyruvate dehydrogenase E2 component (dihydrolipoamide acetyltransferase)
MPINILMPALSPTMTEGNLAKWHVKEGDEVASGDVLAEIETDKATMEVEAVDEGTVGKILVPEGAEGIAVNAVIAMLLEEGEDASSLDGAPAAAPQPAATAPAATAPVSAPAAPAATPAASASAASGSNGSGRIFASPLARRMAAQAGVELTVLRGTGPHGRIVKADVEAMLAGGTPTVAPVLQPAAAPAVAPPPTAATPAAPAGPGARQLADAFGMAYRQEPLSSMRKVIAQRLSEAKQSVPHFYLTLDCEVDALLKVRKELNAKSDAYKISVNDFVIRAAALALKQVPAANASFDPQGLIYYDHADVSVAVATPNGLITPIIKAAESKGLAVISNEMKDFAARARDGKLKPEEYQGGSFSVSNLGMFGVKDFAAIINPPQGCILAVGAGAQRPVVKDGAVGAEFLAALKRLIEDPLMMLL